RRVLFRSRPAEDAVRRRRDLRPTRPGIPADRRAFERRVDLRALHVELVVRDRVIERGAAVREIDRLGLLDAQGPVLASGDANLTDARTHAAAASDERLDAVQRVDAAHAFDEPLR